MKALNLLVAAAFVATTSFAFAEGTATPPAATEPAMAAPAKTEAPAPAKEAKEGKKHKKHKKDMK